MRYWPMGRKQVASGHSEPLEDVLSGGPAYAIAGRWALALVPVLAGLLAIDIYSKAVWRLAWLAPEILPGAVVAVCGLAVLLAPCSYPDAARPAKFLLVGLAVTIGLYGLALGTVLGMEASIPSVEKGLSLGWYALIPMTILAIFRPSFALYPFLYVAAHKELTRALSGAGELGVNDYLPLVELGLFITVSLLVLSIMGYLLRRSSPADRTGWSDADFEAVSAVLILVVAVGAHLGNYFMSGLAKISLDGGPLSWALENPTSSLMLAGHNLGTAPLSLWPDIFVGVYSMFRVVETPLNVVTLLAQLLCFAAFFRRTLLVGFAFFFDLMHVAIYVATGALFIPWIILNSLIVGALVRNRIRLGPVAVAVGALTTVMGHTVFYNARLGWYDSRQIRHAHFVAITEEGEEIPVPSNFFRESSYLMLARHFDFREDARPSGHIPTSAWGQIGILVAPPEWLGMSFFDLMKLADQCAYKVEAPSTAADFDRERPAPFIRGQHQRALRLQEAGDATSYNLYPHHHFSLPGRFQEFEALDLDEIVAYRYVVETVCMSIEDGEVRRNVMTRTTGPRIEVDGPS